MPEVGPVEYMVVAFPENKFRGEVGPAVAELADAGVIRVIDIAFVSKDAEGNVASAELEDVDSAAGRAFKTIEAEIGELVSEDDLQAIGVELEPQSSAAVLVWEDVWATKLKGAIRNAGGVLVHIERLPYEIVDAALAHALGAEEDG